MTGATNKLGSRAYLKFTVEAAGPHRITATTTSMPAGERADPDIVLHQHGVVFESDGPPADDCVAGAPDACLETFTLSLAPGDYVLDVHEWTNTNSETDPDYPPIGATCFDVEAVRP